MDALKAARIYDSFPPGQTMGREAFIKQAVTLTDSDRFQADTQALLTMRSTAQAEKVKIERVLRHD
mgnify:CR=1 FL=1